MSIKEIIKERCDQGLLFPIDPFIPSDGIIRELYVSAEIHMMLDNYGKEDKAWGTVKATMDNFISGELISVGHKKTSQIGFLKPLREGVCEIRSTKPRPGIRILGQFAEKDLFIALVWKTRIDLKGFNSLEWKIIIRSCKAEWRKLFSPYPPLIGGNENDYISNIFFS